MAIKEFNGKVAAITGAGSGMGRALAVRLSQFGCHLSLCDVNQDALDETISCVDKSVNTTTQLVDVASRDQIESFASQTVQDQGKANLVFNNAGVSVTGSAEQMPYEDIEWLMNINFWGVVYGCKSFLPFLRQVDEAAIVNTSSIFGTIAVPSQSAYNASKFAVRGYTLALRQELTDTPIGVSCVQPGGVRTNIVATSRFIPSDNESATREDLEKEFLRLARLSPEGAADQILAGVLKNKARILVCTDAKLVSWVERLAPSGYMRLLSGLGEKLGS